MNKRALTLVSSVPLNPAPSSLMSAGGVFHSVQGGAIDANRPQRRAFSSKPVSIASHRIDGNSFVSVHPRSSGLRGYRSLAATGALLGVPEAEVLELIEHGPLVGRELDGELLVHADDLDDFLELRRRPRLVAGA